MEGYQNLISTRMDAKMLLHLYVSDLVSLSVSPELPPGLGAFPKDWFLWGKCLCPLLCGFYLQSGTGVPGGTQMGYSGL